MSKPYFTFTKHKNSFSVHVENLEMLSVRQIQEIEHFVSERKGYFDFDTYTFTIRKNLEYQEFIRLLQTLHVEATTREAVANIQNSVRINFGQYKGMPYNELPDSYLLWLKNNYIGSDREIICGEIAKRNI
ncbi:DUF3820 family protein [Sulfurimonas autotrophica]|uniref:Uncharacterized protein n=1 Tax=Sulfurimonas autotrophica (strain ATCC BAA-671 / DSM 16294 / JCM 11897 / OK10) TaxID=563040 RepID=E0USJ1_SULAO|nr:DUF3820 family protein [Sulfurimonas autotrophica]ADN09154.1 conserved hypothetical protein [Sulfurimonas autotrophica DSM 16294]